MISISILSVQNNIEKIKEVDFLGGDYIHLDVMDGNFVKETAHMDRLEQYHSPVDLHLMVEDIDSYIEAYKKYHPEYISFHVEATNEVEKYIKKIHSLGSKVGLAISPNTSLNHILPYLSLIDMVLVMTVEPGLGGQSLIPETLKKVDELESLRKDSHYSYVIEVDGGINKETKSLVEKADILVIGSYITKSDNMREKLDSLR